MPTKFEYLSLEEVADNPLTNPFEIYAMLKAQKDDLEAQMDALKPVLIEAIGDGQVKRNGLTFSISSRTTWTFPKSVKAKIKAIEEDAKAKGLADYKTSQFLTVRASKQGEN